MKNHRYILGIIGGVASILFVSTSSLALADAVKIRVLAPDGKAVAGARVFVSQAIKRGAKPVAPLTATTDEMGTANFDLQPFSKGAEFYGNVTIIGPDRAIEGGALKAGDNEFRLKESRAVSGRVVDEAGAPVAGVRVVLRSITFLDLGEEEVRFVDIPTELEKEMAAISDAQGNWRIEGLPKGSQGDVYLDDERFADDRDYRQNDDGDNIVLTARPGAILEGRVVDEAGQPVEGVAVYGSGSDNYAQGVTDAQGKYRISGLRETDALSVRVLAQSDSNLIAPLLPKIGVAAKTTTQAPDLVMAAGQILEGVVSDAATGKPLAGASVSAIIGKTGQLVGISSAESGADGRYQLRVLPGEVALRGSHPDYSSRGPGSPNEPIQLIVKTDAKPTKNLALTPRVTLAGQAVDEAGKAVSGAKFRIGERWGGRPPIVTDENGAWSAKNNQNDGGTAYLSSVDNWIVVSPKQIKLPAKDPVKVVLRRATFESLKGRVVTPDGKPIAGATITMSSVEQENGPGPNYVSQLPAVTSDKNGAYEFKTLVSGHRPIQLVAKLDNYLSVSGPDYEGFTQQGAGWKAGDSVLAPFAAPLKGRVVGADGQPAIGAFVVADRGAAGLVKTGDDGTFTLDKMIVGDLNVMAFTGNDAASARATVAAKTATDAAGALLTLTLAPSPAPKPRDVAGAYKILADLAETVDPQIYGRRQIAELLEPFDAKLAQDLRLAAGIAGPGAVAQKQSDIDLWREIVSSPEKAALRADEYLAKVEPRQKKAFRSMLGSTLGLTMVETDAPRAEELWQTSETILRGMTPGERGGSLSETVIAMSITSALASKLNKPSAASWPAFIANVIETQYPVSRGMRDDIKRRVLVFAARGSKENYEAYATAATPAIRAAALGESMRDIATSDPRTGLALLDQIDALPNTQRTADDEDGYQGNSKQEVFGRAAIALIPRLVKVDATAALAVARRIPNESQKALGLALAAGGQKAEARNAIFREAFDAAGSFGQRIAARVAALAFASDPIFGKTLFDRLLVNIENQQRGDTNGEMGDYETPEVAFYVARADAAAARRLLERTFASQKSKAGRGMDWQIGQTARAMAAVSLDRALEMSRSLSDENQRFGVQVAIATYALASEAERGTVSFAEFGNGSWKPGQAAGEQNDMDE